MNAYVEIKQITTSEVLPIRHKVMWPNKPIAYVGLANDENARHFGLFVNGEIASILSIFVENNEAQFRKFATLTEFQGLRYGTMLLKSIIDLVEKEGIRKLWCNARLEKLKFYERFNLKPTDKKFVKGGIEYVIMEKTFASNSYKK
jgi:GNAT superfamily N-acetyltransferase